MIVTYNNGYIYCDIMEFTSSLCLVLIFNLQLDFSVNVEIPGFMIVKLVYENTFKNKQK